MIVVKKLLRILVGCVPAVVVCLVSALLVCLDVVVGNGTCSEDEVVEIAQSAVVLAIAFVLAIVIRRRPDLRGGAWLMFGFFLDILIREQDAHLDHIYHGFWACPALVVALACIYMAFRSRETLAASFAHVRVSRHFDILALGLSMLLVFSRIFGNKIIWKTVVGHDDFRVAKHVAEEGTELLAYMVLCLWAISYCRECLQDRAKKMGDGASNCNERVSGR